MKNNNFKKGDYVVLLSGCDGTNTWPDSIPINYCYKLRDDSDDLTFRVERDKKGNKFNGWYTTLPYDSKLLLRAAISSEIKLYEEFGKPFSVSIYISESYEYLIPLLKELDNEIK